jgi:hypothetical protein
VRSVSGNLETRKTHWAKTSETHGLRTRPGSTAYGCYLITSLLIVEVQRTGRRRLLRDDPAADHGTPADGITIALPLTVKIRLRGQASEFS